MEIAIYAPISPSSIEGIMKRLEEKPGYVKGTIEKPGTAKVEI